MAIYKINLHHTFLVETDNIEETMSNYEFPTFSEKSEFIFNANDWEVSDVSKIQDMR